jgi:heat shock protein HslJ
MTLIRLMTLGVLTSLAGCALYHSEASAPINGNWIIEYIGDRPVMDSSPASITFDTDRQLSGNASCNRFSGRYAGTASALSVGPLATTRMMCPEALMEQEQRFLSALTEIASARIDNGLLYLDNAAGATLFRASRQAD